MEWAPTGLVACFNSFYGMLHVYIYISISLSSHQILSLSSIHILRIESLIRRLHHTELRIESIPKTPARASVVVHGPAFCVVVNSSLCVSINAMASFQVDSGVRSRALPKERKQKSYVLPQDHGALAALLPYLFKIALTNSYLALFRATRFFICSKPGQRHPSSRS